jgi:NTP pyrophosphatase (non-canonical NTP hydrolase)
MQIRNSVKWFSEQMEFELANNDRKSGWRNMSVDALYARLLDEVCELQSELSFPTRDDSAIISECADVANFAMMIADIIKEKSAEKSNE